MIRTLEINCGKSSNSETNLEKTKILTISMIYLSIVTIFGVHVVESMRSLLNDNIRFVNKRNFRNKQALSAMVIYNDAVHTQRSMADSTGNQTQRYYLT